MNLVSAITSRIIKASCVLWPCDLLWFNWKNSITASKAFLLLFYYLFFIYQFWYFYIIYIYWSSFFYNSKHTMMVIHYPKSVGLSLWVENHWVLIYHVKSVSNKFNDSSKHRLRSFSKEKETEYHFWWLRVFFSTQVR